MTNKSFSFGNAVVAWQKSHGRHDLPWQNTQDPYAVWLSEIMLQQTQVSTVREYFAKFLKRFPTVGHLAAAHQDDVLGLWSGLGYYSRARNMHRAAQDVMNLHGGVFPDNSETLQTLPGIGRSTAAAVASLCFGEPVAILDGNVKRVLTRYLGFQEDLATSRAEKNLWQLAQTMLPTQNIKRSMPFYTQGVMDLGATVCTPKKPRCDDCPLSANCLAYAQGDPEKYPVKTRKIKRTSEQLWLLHASAPDGSVWLLQRPQSGVWAGLFCMPGYESLSVLEASVPQKYRSELFQAPAVKHVLTHKDLYLHPVTLRLPKRVNLNDGQWVGQDRWPQMGLPAPIRKLLEAN